MNKSTRARAIFFALTAMLTAVAIAPVETSRAVADEPSAQSKRTKDVSFDDIKFTMKDPKSRLFKRSMLSEEIEKISDAPIRIRGYILPSFKQKGITQFVLVRDNKECCFGPGAALLRLCGGENESRRVDRIHHPPGDR